ncbi:hypothetical protein AAC387_Pa01g2701 [Persea americana]
MRDSRVSFERSGTVVRKWMILRPSRQLVVPVLKCPLRADDSRGRQRADDSGTREMRVRERRHPQVCLGVTVVDIALDGNNGIILAAFAVVEAEIEDT